jgi:hypothetical protein
VALSAQAYERVQHISAEIRDYWLLQTPERRTSVEALLQRIADGGTGGLTRAITDEEPVASEAFVEGDSPAAVEDADVAAFSESVDTPQGSDAPKRGWLELVLDYSSVLTSILTGLVVVYVGYQTQFLSDTTFSGGLAFLKLLGWAFAIQVTGVTVLEMAGRIKGTTP